MHPEIKEFWENQGYEIKTSDRIHANIDQIDSNIWTNELFYAWTDNTHYFLIADIGANSKYYFFEWNKYSEEEMLKLIKNKTNASGN